MKNNITILLDCFGLFADPGLSFFFAKVYGDAERAKDRFCVPGDLGEMSFTAVVKAIALDLGKPYEEVSSILMPNYHIYPEMFALAKELRERYHVYLLSNCMQGQIETIFKDYPFDDCFDGQIRSYELHLQKPDKAIYQKALEMIPPSKRVIFFDDTPKNIEEAKACGIEGYVFKNVKQARKILREIL